MKKIIPSLLAGLVLGSAATWLALKHPVADTSTPPPDTAPKIEAGKAPGNSQFTTKTPTPATIAAEVTGYGRVLDPATFVALVGDTAVTNDAAMASEKEFNRTKALYDNGENATLQAVETAEAAMLRDKDLHATAVGKACAAWGRNLVERSDFATLEDSIQRGEVALVRIDLLPGDAPDKMPATVQVGPLTGPDAVQTVELVGLAPVDPQAQGVGYLGLLRDHPPAPGTALRATFAGNGEPLKVMVVPASALVRHEGGVHVYVKVPDGGYERRLVEVVRNLPDGVALGGTVVDENDQVVVTGAQQLLANEILSTLGGGD
jgi:hypothetical protein